MQIDDALILRLENLARLDLSAAERTTMQGSLTNILTMVEQLNTLNTEGVEPLIYINEDVNVWREDTVNHQLDRQDALKNAPDSDGTFFKVPKVIDL